MVSIHTPHKTQDSPTRQPREGKWLLAHLRAAGIEAKNVTRNRKTGIYVVDFDADDVDDFYSLGTDPAHVWAQRIRERLPAVEIIDTHDAVADWRPYKPVLAATVFLRSK